VDLEGTELKSTGEAGGTKFLREDGDGTCSWQTGGIASVAADGSPQLGGDIDLNGNNIDFPTTANISDCLDEDDMASDSATMLATQQSIKKYVDDNAGSPKNLLINGGMNFKQRGTSGTYFTSATTPANNDDTYLLDRWILLSDGNDIVDVLPEADAEGVSGKEDGCWMEMETIQKKFGIFQIIERDNLKTIMGGSEVVSLSFEAKVGSATRFSDIRAVVLSWDGASDSPTSDCISAWGAEGSNPTYVANWTAENTPANLSVTASFARYTIENISMDTANFNNVGVLIWQNNVATADTLSDTLLITNVQLEKGATASAFEYRQTTNELSLCQRYYQKSYQAVTAPGGATIVGSVKWYANNINSANHTAIMHAGFATEMRGIPTVIAYDMAGTAGKVTMAAGDGITATIDGAASTGFNGQGVNGASSTTRNLYFHYTAEAEL